MGATFHGAQVNRSTDQVITPVESVVWDTVFFDTDGFFDPLAPTLLTIPTSGVYWFGFALGLDPINAGGEFDVIRSPAGFGVLSFTTPSGDTSGLYSASGIWDFVAGETIELSCGVDCTIGGGSSIPYFWIARYT